MISFVSIFDYRLKCIDRAFEVLVKFKQRFKKWDLLWLFWIIDNKSANLRTSYFSPKTELLILCNINIHICVDDMMLTKQPTAKSSINN